MLKSTSLLAFLTPGLLASLGQIDINVWILVGTTVLGLSSVLLQGWLKNRADVRNHEWDVADRIATAQLQARRQNAVAESVAQVKDTVVEHSHELKTLIDENTDISRTAFKEANSVNAKIASLGQTLVENQAGSSTVLIPTVFAGPPAAGLLPLKLPVIKKGAKRKGR